MAEKTTVMVLNVVDLKCHCCYKKIKKLLCKFPQIRNQVYDEKQNKVTITVVCCNPEKIRDKLCCKGGKSIKSIEIVEPPKPKPPEKPKAPEKPKEPEKPKAPEKPKEPEKKDPPKASPPKTPAPPPPGPPVYPVGTCCGPCSEGYGGGPCYQGHGRPIPPPPCYDGYGYLYGYGNRPCVTRCDYYFSEENPSACTIM